MGQLLYIPQVKTRTVTWIDADDPEGTPFVVTVRSNLTFGERNELIFDKETMMTEVHERLAPFVTAWNIGTLDAKGEPVPVPPPAEAGGSAFEQVPNALFWFVWNEVRSYAVQRLDPTPPSDAASSDAPSDEASTAT